MKKYLFLLFLISTNVYSFNFKLINPFIGIKTFGNYKAFGDGSLKRTCAEYLNPGLLSHYVHRGNTGNGIYRIKPDGVNVIDVYYDFSP